MALWVHGFSIICKISFLSGQYAGSSSVYLQIKALVEIERPRCLQIDSSSTSSEISFQELPNKSKRPSIRKQIASWLSSQLSAERYLANMFLQVFL